MPMAIRTVLRSVSCLYSAVIEIYRSLFQWGILRTVHLPCHVVSMGNLTMGGVGKTVATQSLARALAVNGKSVVIICYGFRANSSEPCAVVSDREHPILDPTEAGDEPSLLARSLPGIPVLIGKRRAVAGALAMERFQPDIILLDDGFQHWRLFRNRDLVLLDARRPLGNGRVFPAGPLRERPGSLNRADAVILTRTRRASADEIEGTRRTLARLAPGCAIYETEHRVGEPYPLAGNSSYTSPELLRGVLLVGGIGDNSAFFQSMQERNFTIKGTVAFPNHHRYSSEDVRAILDRAVDIGPECEAVITTEKDAVKLAPLWSYPLPLLVVPVQLSGISDTEWLEIAGING